MKKLLTSLLVAGVLVGAVYGAAASIAVGGVDDIGSGIATITAPPDVSGIEWELDANDSTVVTSAKVTFDTSVGAGSDVTLQILEDGDGPANCDGSNETSKYNVTQAGSGAVLQTFSSMALAVADIDCVIVTVNG